MPITNTQEIYEVRSISPQVINPSIMEGTRHYSSVLGPDRAVSINRYAPIFLFAPLLTGDPGIPSILTCSAGVVDASPSPYRQYEWFVDGVTSQIGIGPTFSTFLTNSTMDAKEITCEVTAVNLLGSASAMSNGITVTIIEPVILGEYTWYGVTGLNAEDSVTVFMDQIFLLTGMWVDDFVTVFSDHIFTLTGLGIQDSMGLLSYDTYAALFVEFLADVTFSNHNAESDLTGWTTSLGTILASTGPNPFGAGTKVWRGNNAANSPATLTRIIDIDSSNHDEIDDEIAHLSMSFYCNTIGISASYGAVRGYYRILDASNSVLSTQDFFGLFEPGSNIQSGNSNFWQRLSSPAMPVPALGRKVQLVFEFPGSGSASGNICQIDEISLTLFKSI